MTLVAFSAAGDAGCPIKKACGQSERMQGTMSDKPNTAVAAGFQNADAYEAIMGRWSRRLAPLLIRFGGLSD